MTFIRLIPELVGETQLSRHCQLISSTLILDYLLNAKYLTERRFVQGDRPKQLKRKRGNPSFRGVPESPVRR